MRFVLLTVVFCSLKLAREPVLVHKKPNVGKQYIPSTVQDGDEFNGAKFGLQWQWQAAIKLV